MSNLKLEKRKSNSNKLAWLLRFLAAVFQLVSAHATYSGALKFVVNVRPFAAIITFGIQLGLLVTVHLLGEILSGGQKERTSSIPPLLALCIVLPLSVFFSAFGFYQHYGLAQGNRAVEIRLTAEEVRGAVTNLDRYRVEALTFLSGEVERRETDKKRQQVRAASTRLSEASRSTARVRAAQLEREVNGLKQAVNRLQEVDALGSATRETPDAMRRDLLATQQTISNTVAQHAPGYLKDHPVPQSVPIPPPAAEVQEAFFRDLRLQETSAVTTLALASVVDFLSSLFILCGLKVSPTEQRILSIKRKIGRIIRAAFPIFDMADTYTPVQFRARGAGVTSEFLVHFLKADEDLYGADVLVNLPAIQEQLNRGRQAPVKIQDVLNDAGEELSPEQPLFKQLGADRTVCLRMVQYDKSDWSEEFADEAA